MSDAEIQSSPSMNAQLYAAYMEEIKQRSEAITAAIMAVKSGRLGPSAYMQAEFACLQLRYIGELVALSSLAMGLGFRLLKVWSAGEAFALLEQINPHCFPSSVRNIPDSKGVHNFHFVEGPVKLTRGELARIYAGCGSVLHRGVIRDAIDGKAREYDLDALNLWHGQIIELLTQHMILIRDPDRTLLVNFHSDKGRMAVYEAEAVKPWELAPEVRAVLGASQAG